MTTNTSKSAGTQAEGGKSPRAEPGLGPARWWTAIGTSGLALLPLALLGAAFWIGRLVRPGGDDWCFLPVVRDEGASGMIGKFFLHDNGRIANALLVIGYGAFGVPGHQWFALVSGVLMLGILWALVASVLKRAGLTAPRGLALLVGATTAALFFFATPNPYKAFYWPASSVSHTVAPVLACAAVIPLLRARTRWGRAFALGVAYLAGIFIGTLSEETAIVAVVVLAAALLMSRWALPGAGRTRTRVWCVVAFAGVAVGTAILYLSPGARFRRGRFGADSTSMFGPEALTAALRSFAHVLGTVFTTWQYLGAVAVGVLLGLLVRESERGTDVPDGSLRRRPSAWFSSDSSPSWSPATSASSSPAPSSGRAWGPRRVSGATSFCCTCCSWSAPAPCWAAGCGAAGGGSVRRRRASPPSCAPRAASASPSRCSGWNGRWTCVPSGGTVRTAR